jgi:hypothetical protein
MLYDYSIGPWLWTNRMGGSYNPPPGAIGGLDLAPVHEQAIPGSDRAVGVFISPRGCPLPSEYRLLGSGDSREIAASAAMQDAFQSLVGVRPQGERLADLLWDCLTNLSDPAGQDAPKTLMPSATQTRLVLGREVKREAFRWGGQHTNRVRDVLRFNVRAIVAEVKTSQARRVLDYYRLKHRTDWREFVPSELRDELDGPLPHETTITETFNGTNADPLGPNLTWVFDNHGSTNTWEILSNRANKTATNAEQQFARADSALSSDDQRSQANVYGGGAGYGGPVCRMPNSQARTGYLTLLDGTTQYLTKLVAGTSTNFHTESNAFADGVLLKVTANDSTIAGFEDGVEILSTTDSAITGNLYAGISMYLAHTAELLDNFEAADLAAGVVIGGASLCGGAMNLSGGLS